MQPLIQLPAEPEPEPAPVPAAVAAGGVGRWKLAAGKAAGDSPSKRKPKAVGVAGVVAAAAAAMAEVEDKEAARKAARKASEAGFKASFGSCKDLLGTMLDRERLRVARNQAVARGLDWMVRSPLPPSCPPSPYLSRSCAMSWTRVEHSFQQHRTGATRVGSGPFPVERPEP